MEKTEYGLMILKDGRGWGVTREGDGKVSDSEGWVDFINATLYEPEHINRPSDVTYAGSPYEEELDSGDLVKTKRVTTIEFIQ